MTDLKPPMPKDDRAELRLPSRAKTQLRDFAADRGVSMSAVVLWALGRCGVVRVEADALDGTRETT